MRIKLLILLTIAGILLPQYAVAEQVRIISYNVENLFDTQHDTLKADTEFTPQGERHWTQQRYKNKLINIARVIANISGWTTPALIGLCEVENKKCLNDLLYVGGLKQMGYKYLHHESEDTRGIDCALLYHPDLFRLDTIAFLTIPLPEGTRKTREIIFAAGRTHNNNKLYIMVCHLPSQLGGAAATNEKRQIAKNVIQHATDSLLLLDPNARIIVMGDMNSKPQNDIAGLTNMMYNNKLQAEGTHKWQGRWTCLDQFYISTALQQTSKASIYNADWILETDEKFLGQKPFRTYNGYKYIGGYSDHLPIVLDTEL